MRAALIALMLTFATQAGAECSKLCDPSWWETATPAYVQAELDAGADVMARDEHGDTPLHWAARYGTLEAIQALLDAGANVMARNKHGYTALHGAVERETPANIQTLLDAGADVMARADDGWTPLHEAARWGGREEIIPALLAAGADATVKDNEGRTPWNVVQDNDNIIGTDAYTALGKATCGWSYWFKNLIGWCS